MGKEYCNETEMLYTEPYLLCTVSQMDTGTRRFDGVSFSGPCRGNRHYGGALQEVSDIDYLKLIARYRANPCEKTEKLLSRHLADAKRVPLYQYIYKLVIKASKDYPERNYGNQINERIKKSVKRLKRSCFKGIHRKIPCVFKKNTTVRVMEEQPYVPAILEWDDYKYKQQLMVSECSAKRV